MRKKDAYVVCYTHEGQSHHDILTNCGFDPLSRVEVSYMYDYKEVEAFIKLNLAHVDSPILICKVVDLIKVDLKSLVDE